MRVEAPIKVDRKTKRLAKRLTGGEIAVINHIDIDEVAANSLVEGKIKLVINAAQSISGRYPNKGPGILTEKNIIDKIIHIVNDINNNRECYTIKELNINGNDLKQLGYRGSDIGKILSFLLNKVQENPHINHKVELIKLLNKDI